MVRLGWTEAAMIAGAREISVFPSIVGSFPQKEAALIEELGVCFAFVEFEDVESVQNAIKASPIQLAGRQVYIEERKPSSSSYSNISREEAYFNAPEGVEPLALDMKSTGKGQVWINGQSIGRYWTTKGCHH